MKKSLIFSTTFTALLTASAVFAGGPEVMMIPESPFNGFYVGGDGSFHHTGFDLNETTNLVVTDDGVTTTTTLATQNGGDTSTDGYYGVTGGWGKVFMNRWYGGIVGWADFGNADGSISTTENLFSRRSGRFLGSENTTNSGHVGTDWGVAAKLGILLSPTTLAYAKLGAEWANVKADVSSTTFNAENNSTTTIASNTTSSTESGFLWGFGAEQFVWRNMVSLFAEYTYVSLGSVTATDSLVFPSRRRDPNRTVAIQDSNTNSPDISAFTGGLNFHFGSNWL